MHGRGPAGAAGRHIPPHISPLRAPLTEHLPPVLLAPHAAAQLPQPHTSLQLERGRIPEGAGALRHGRTDPRPPRPAPRHGRAAASLTSRPGRSGTAPAPFFLRGSESLFHSGKSVFPPPPERPAGLAEAPARPRRPARCPRPSGVTSVRPERRRGPAGPQRHQRRDSRSSINPEPRNALSWKGPARIIESNSALHRHPETRSLCLRALPVPDPPLGEEPFLNLP